MNNDSLWYKDAIIYQLHIKAFKDADGDGVGDFRGLMEKLDYIKELGVTALWLLPFYPSPLRDDGYDISDYRSINPAYGTMRDFRKFVREAHARDLRVITELVINHTSDQHPWFQRARTAKPGSTYRNFYVWSGDDKKYSDARIIFIDSEKSNWAWDPVAQAYYWHRFYHHQPDLNFDNTRVVREVFNIMRFWLDAGVDGLRLDAIPYLCEKEGTNCENLEETHVVLRKLRRAMDEKYPDRMLLAEANQWPEDVRPYFGNGDECNMAFHFPLMPRMYMAVAQEDRHPITDIMRQTPDIPQNCQWAVFLRNHDELTLEMVTDRERDYLWKFYASDPRARINLGIRRRLAPLLDNDRRKIELMNSLLMSMPGTPVIYYGDEIGMGDNFFLGDRDAVRTPMQWSPDRNGGFSSGDPQQLYLPSNMDPIYGYGTVNVEAANRSPSSLLNWMRKLIKQHQARRTSFGRGEIRFLYPNNRKILAYLRESDHESILCVANLARSAQPVGLDLSAFRGRTPLELLGQTYFPPVGDLPYLLTLPPYGFLWFLLEEESDAPAWAEFAVPMQPELATLVVPEGWSSLRSGRALKQLLVDVVPSYIERQRWFTSKETEITEACLDADFELTDRRQGWMVATMAVSLANGGTANYFMPLSMEWESPNYDPIVTNLSRALARVRKGPRMGLLTEAVTDSRFIRALVTAIGGGKEVKGDYGALRFWHTKAFPNIDGLEEMQTRPLGAEQSNTSIVIGDKMILKAFRKLETGVHPEVEMGRYLTDMARYPHTPPLLGAVEYVNDQGKSTALLILQSLVANQGDGWTYTINYLRRFLNEARTKEMEAGSKEEIHGSYVTLMENLGLRVGKLHQALTMETRDTAFKPEPASARDFASWKSQVHKEAEETFVRLRNARKNLAPEQQEQVAGLLRQRRRLLSLIKNMKIEKGNLKKTRFHGDLHLGQILVAEDDFYIIDFEGEPARPFSQRRSKSCALKDVAGMLRSFNYAGWAAVFEYTKEHNQDIRTLLPLIEDWESVASDAFTESYRKAMEGCDSCPQDIENLSCLLDLFILEKALYELRYELANRPGWLRIPLQGILSLMERYGGREREL